MSDAGRPRLRLVAAVAGFALLGAIVVLQFVPPRNQAFWLLALAVGAYLAYAAYEAWTAPPPALEPSEDVKDAPPVAAAPHGASRPSVFVAPRHPAQAHLDAPTLLCLLAGTALFSVNRYTALGGVALIVLGVLIRPRRLRGVYLGACPHCDADVSSLPAIEEGRCASCGGRFTLEADGGARGRFIAVARQAPAGGR